MEIIIYNNKRKRSNIIKKHINSIIIDVTSKGDEPYSELSPFYPIGDIPIPGMDGYFSMTVEGLWQGLKVFEKEGISTAHFKKSASGLKRLSKWYGKVLGHSFNGKLLDYIEARKQIYLPAYRFVLDNKRNELVNELRHIALKKTLVLLDTTTNDDINNIKKPLSHAAIIKAAILEDYSILEHKQETETAVQLEVF